MTAAAKSYHHGDLRNTLILAASQLIEDSGSLNFAMADAARQAGVSTAAPYRHFRDRDALLEAVSQLAFFGLGERVREAIASTRQGSIETIIAIGQAYIQYVIEKAAFYDLMWGDIGARAMDADSFDQKASGFYMLVDSVEAYVGEQGLRNVDVLDLAVKLWSMVHGMSAISMSGKLPHFHPDADIPEMLDSSTRTFMAGLKQAE
ncbi:TetR/AcrR family transcriptional regulator [Congregibacter litoralis]|uniref:Transcriptional regulator, TetR family n=1 Tax=Congregibacter litoralis KT71 TaxID=314285 RepID=A4A866_9GAMM|nr:TetR/AcrR family transcriptional regulator [Congregibacter litoralis]EAQ97861.1 transcriptional regulator, TetR family [Congregibacter litoralis KT71]